MASECKLCALLGATELNDSSDGNPITHAQLHARQLELIGLNHKELAIDKTPRNGSLISDGSGKYPKEKSKKNAFIRICRELIKIYGKDGSIKCSQCKHSVRSQRRTAKTTSSLINHACIHLNKDLFACRQCHLKFVSRSGMYHHLHSIHSLSGIRANYIDKMDDHQSEIMDMVKLCFGKAPQKQLTMSVTPFGQQKRYNIQGQAPLLKLSYNFIWNHQRGDRIQCNLCPRSIQNNDRKDSAARMLLDHACWHVDKPIFTCRLCKYSASTEGTVTQHLKKIHSVAGSKQNFKDGSSEYFEDISSMLKDCFGDMKNERPPVISQEQKRACQAQCSIRSKCGANFLLAERHLRCSELTRKFQRSGKLQCRICHVHLAVMKDGKTGYVRISMTHALAHLNKILFTCRRCSYTSTTMSAMGHHVRSKHGVPLTNEFDDRTDDFHADFMDMVSKCFDWNMEPKRSEVSISAAIVPSKNILAMTSKMHGNDLKASRHIHAIELIKKHVQDGKIVCLICSHSASVSKKAGSQSVFKHAISHLDKDFWPYRCKLCPYVSGEKSYIRQQHMKKVHKDKDANEFEDMSDKFHSEIMECLSKCYDRSVESG